MDKRTLKALKGSIEKWRKIVAGRIEDRGHLNCPLCQQFRKSNGLKVGCGDCPVALATNHEGCDDSPYVAWEEHNGRDHAGGGRCHQDCDQCKALAQAELAFLRSLLPKKRKPA